MRNTYQRLTRLLDNTPSIVKPIGYAVPLLGSAQPIYPLNKKKIHVLPINIGVRHVGHQPKQ